MNSLVAFRNSQGVDARGTLLKLTRTTLIFEVYNPYSIVQLSEVLNDVHIRRGERVVYRGRAIVGNLVNTGLMLIVSANLLDSWTDLAGVLSDGEMIRQEVAQFVTEWEMSSQLRPGYQLVVSQLRSLMTELHRWLEQIDPTPADHHGDATSLMPENRFRDLAEPILLRLNDLFQAFENEAAEVPDSEVVNHKHFAQRDLLPLILRAPFVHRAFYKPLGYAGDYEMVNMMLQDSRKGPTVYAQLVNTLYLQAGPAAAHRNRIDIVVQWLDTILTQARERGSRLRILNVGCGPAVELQRLLSGNFPAVDCQFDLIDFNLETLDYTRSRIEEALQGAHREIGFEFVHQSVHMLLKQASAPSHEQTSNKESYDLIYCAGLFDYLSDKVCARLLQLFYRWLQPGGRILTTNVHPNNSNRWAMEFLLEWHLIYRDESRMTQLAPHLGRQSVFMDDTRINVFLEIKKPIANE